MASLTKTRMGAIAAGGCWGLEIEPQRTRSHCMHGTEKRPVRTPAFVGSTPPGMQAAPGFPMFDPAPLGRWFASAIDPFSYPAPHPITRFHEAAGNSPLAS